MLQVDFQTVKPMIRLLLYERCLRNLSVIFFRVITVSSCGVQGQAYVGVIVLCKYWLLFYIILRSSLTALETVFLVIFIVTSKTDSKFSLTPNLSILLQLLDSEFQLF